MFRHAIIGDAYHLLEVRGPAAPIADRRTPLAGMRTDLDGRRRQLATSKIAYRNG